MEKENVKVKVKGNLLVSEEVIASIALNAVKDIKSVVGVMPQQKTLRQYITRQPGLENIKVGYVDDVVEISLRIVIKSGTKAMSVAEQIQEHVKNTVQSMTGITVARVNVTIGGIDYGE